MGMAMFFAVFNENQWPTLFLLDWKPTILKLQFWRLFTPFLYLGPLGLNFVLTAHFTWTYMSQLEKLHYREPHTFVMLLAFGMGRTVERCLHGLNLFEGTLLLNFSLMLMRNLCQRLNKSMHANFDGHRAAG